jgi:hypothetical protein
MQDEQVQMAFVGFSITQTLGFGSPQMTLKDNKSNGPGQNWNGSHRVCSLSGVGTG